MVHTLRHPFRTPVSDLTRPPSPVHRGAAAAAAGVFALSLGLLAGCGTTSASSAPGAGSGRSGGSTGAGLPGNSGGVQVTSHPSPTIHVRPTAADAIPGLRGQVRDASGKPVSGALITAVGKAGQAVPEIAVLSGADGTYAYPGLRPGPYAVYATVAGVRTPSVVVTVAADGAASQATKDGVVLITR